MSKLEDKVLTDNPLLDEIIWNINTLARNCIIKDQDEADNYETKESLYYGDLYLEIKDYGPIFDRFTYNVETLTEFYDYKNNVDRFADPNRMHVYAKNNKLIPMEDRKNLAKFAGNKFIETYVERNEYYRMLNGTPPLGLINPEDDLSIWEGIWIDITTINNRDPDISMKKPKDIEVENNGVITRINNYRLIHELSPGYIDILYSTGFIDRFINDDDLLKQLRLRKVDVRYLKYIGSRRIDIYSLRKSEMFDLLYVPESDSVEIQNRFKEVYNANKISTKYTVYSEAYKYESKYYDKFMIILLLIQTIVDMIVELPEYIIRRDIFDIRTCEYIFESNGVDFFSNIPLKYQVAMVKNLNKLIKFKSTDKCIVDICSIFGCKDIEIFKYYILKDHKTPDRKGTEYYDYKDNDIDNNYNIKFLKVPILDNYDKYININKNILSYEELTDKDRYWSGTLYQDDSEFEKDLLKQKTLSEIKKIEFNILKSKYYSTEAVIDISKKTFQLIYFMNSLLYNDVDSSKLTLQLPNISTSKNFELVDVILVLYSMTYMYYGISDDIYSDDRSKVMRILGFNFKADIDKINQHLFERYNHSLDHYIYMKAESGSRGLSIEEINDPMKNKLLLHRDSNRMKIPKKKDVLDKFEKPVLKDTASQKREFINIGQLLNVYKNNKNLYDFVLDQLNKPLRKDVYDAYMYIYKSLFITDTSYEYFSVPSDPSRKFKTIREFINYKDPLLGSFLDNIKNINSEDKRRKKIIEEIQHIIAYLQDYISDENRSNIIDVTTIFSGLPSVSIDFIKQYIQQVIDFYKSFKIFTHNMSINYLFTNKFDNTVKMIDDLHINITLEPSDYVKLEDWLSKITVNMNKKEKYEFIDKVWLHISRFIQNNYDENISRYNNSKDQLKAIIDKFISTFSQNIYLEPRFNHDIVSILYKYTKIFNNNDNSFHKTKDTISNLLINVIKKQDIRSTIKDKILFESEFLKGDRVYYIDRYKYINNIGKKDRVYVIDTPGIGFNSKYGILSTYNKKDKFINTDKCWIEYTRI